jgi:hypothetical protein
MSRHWIPVAAVLLAAAPLVRAQAPPEERIPVTDPSELARLGFASDAKNVFIWSKATRTRSAATAEPKTWGTHAGYTVKMGYNVQEYEHPTVLDHYLGATYCPAGIGGPGYYESVGYTRFEVPDGSKLGELDLWAYDTSNDHDLTVNLWEYCAVPGIGDPTTTLIGTVETVGAIGRFYNFAALNGYHVNTRSCSYNAEVLFTPMQVACVGTQLQLQKLALSWVRQVSPAPATATFADVPTGHPFFQFVEALNASGITGGCGGGNYCPNNPVTRGQMAVFLSKALGLSWP